MINNYKVNKKILTLMRVLLPRPCVTNNRKDVNILEETAPPPKGAQSHIESGAAGKVSKEVEPAMPRGLRCSEVFHPHASPRWPDGLSLTGGSCGRRDCP